MIKEHDWELAVKKLVVDTQNGNIRWTYSPSGMPTPRSINCMNGFYVASVSNHEIAVYEEEIDSSFGYGSSLTTPPPGFPDTHVAIDFVDGDCNSMYRWPYTSYHSSLLEAVKLQASGAQEFLENFLRS